MRRRSSAKCLTRSNAHMHKGIYLQSQCQPTRRRIRLQSMIKTGAPARLVCSAGSGIAKDLPAVASPSHRCARLRGARTQRKPRPQQANATAWARRRAQVNPVERVAAGRSAGIGIRQIAPASPAAPAGRATAPGESACTNGYAHLPTPNLGRSAVLLLNEDLHLVARPAAAARLSLREATARGREEKLAGNRTGLWATRPGNRTLKKKGAAFAIRVEPKRKLDGSKSGAVSWEVAQRRPRVVCLGCGTAASRSEAEAAIHAVIARNANASHRPRS